MKAISIGHSAKEFISKFLSERIDLFMWVVCNYGGYGETAEKVIEGDMSHVKSYA